MDFTRSLRSYLTTSIQRSLSSIIENVTVEEIGILGGDVVLENLRLRKDVLQNALQLPTDYDIASGGVRELRLTIPWTRILARSQPIIQALFRSIEIVVVPVDRSETPPSSRDRSASADQPPSSQPSDQKGGTSSNGSGWMEMTFKKLLANMHVKVENLIIKLEAGDIIASAAFCNLELHSADPRQSWAPSYCECDDPYRPWLFKALTFHDVTVCLDHRSIPSPSTRASDPGTVDQGAWRRSERSNSSSTSGLRRFEAPLLDRATATLRFAIDVSDLLGLGPEGGGRGDGSHGDGNGLGITALDGIYFDPTGYSYSFELTPEDSNDEDGVVMGSLPEAVVQSQALVRYGPLMRWRVPTDTSVYPFDDPDEAWVPLNAETQPPQTDSAKSGVKAPMVVEVHCQKIRVSLSDSQVALLSRLVEMHASARPPPQRRRSQASRPDQEPAPPPIASSAEAGAVATLLQHSMVLTSLTFADITVCLLNPPLLSQARQRPILTRKSSDCVPLFLLEIKSLAIESQSFVTKDVAPSTPHPQSLLPMVSIRDIKIELGSLRVTHHRDESSFDVLLSLVPCPVATRPGNEIGAVPPLWSHTGAAMVMGALCNPLHPGVEPIKKEESAVVLESPATPTLRARTESNAATFVTFSTLQCRLFKAMVKDPQDEHARFHSSLDIAVPASASIVMSFAAAFDAAAFFEPLITFYQTSTPASSTSLSTDSRVQDRGEMYSQFRCLSLEVRLGDRSMPECKEVTCIGRSTKLHLLSTSRLGENKMCLVAERLLMGTCEPHTLAVEPLHDDAMAGALILWDASGIAMTLIKDQLRGKSTQQLQISQSIKLTFRPDGAHLWKCMVDSWLTLKGGRWSPGAIVKAREALDYDIRQNLPRLRCLYYAVGGWGPGLLVDRREGRERYGEAKLEAAYLDQWCYQGSPVGFEPDTVLAPGNWTITWSTTTTATSSVSSSLSSLRLETSEPVELHLSLLKLKSFSQMTQVKRILFPPSERQEEPTTPTTQGESRMVFEGAALELVIHLPWLEDSMPRFHSLGHGVKLVSTKRCNGSTSYSMSCKGFSAYADPPPLTPVSIKQRRLLSAVSPHLNDYLSESDSSALQKALLTTPCNQSTQSPSIPIMLGRNKDDPFLLAWERSSSGRLVNLEGTVAQYDAFFYFPLYFALKRFFRGGSRAQQDRVRDDNTAPDEPFSAAMAPSKSLVFQPSRVLVVDGPICEAQFGVYVHVETFSVYAARGRRSGANIHQFTWTSELGRWELDRFLKQTEEAESTGGRSLFELEEKRPLTDRIQITTAEEMGQGFVTCFQLSPVKFLGLGRLEMYAVQRILNLYGSTTLSPPQISGNDTAGSESRARGRAGAPSSSSASGMMIVCPSVNMIFLHPGILESTPLFRMAFNGCEMRFEQEGIQMALRQVQLQDLRRDGGGGCNLTRRLGTEHGAKPANGGMDVDVSMVFRQPREEGASDMTFQLAPSELTLDMAMLPLIYELGTFGSGTGFVRKEDDGRRKFGVTRRTAGGRVQGQKTAVTKFLSDYFKLVVTGVENNEEDGEEEKNEKQVNKAMSHGQLEFSTDQIIISRRTSSKTIEYYANLVGLRSRVWTVTDGSSAMSSLPSVHLSDSTNVFFSVEEGRAVRGQAASAAPPSLSAVLNLDSFSLHLTPAATSTLGLLCRRFQSAKKSSSTRRSASSPPLPLIGSRGGERCMVRDVLFSQIPFRISESVSSEPEEGLLLSPSLPNIWDCVLLSQLRKPCFGHGNMPDNLNHESFACTLFTWAFPRPTRIMSLILPSILTVQTSKAPVGTFPVVWEISTKVDASSMHRPDQPVDVPVAAVRVEGLPIRTVREAPQPAPSGSDGDKAEYGCDHALTGRVWQLSIIWDKSVDLPLEAIWRHLVMTLSQRIQLRVFATAADEVRATLQVTVPQVDFHLYGETKVAEDPHKEELCQLRTSGLRISCRQRRSRQEMALVTDIESDVVDPSRWTKIPTLRAHGCRVSYRTSDLVVRLAPDNKSVDVWEQRALSLSTSLDKLHVDLSRKILLSLGQLQEVKYFGKGRASVLEKPDTSRRYRIINTTRHNLWFGQQATAETVKLSPLSDILYSSRALPRADTPTSPLIQELCLRFALNMRQWKGGEPSGEKEDQPSVWSEPVIVEQEGSQSLVLMTSDSAVEDDVHMVSFVTANKTAKEVVLWVVVERQGLEMQVHLHGGYQLKSYLPIPVEYRFSLEEIYFGGTIDNKSKDTEGSPSTRCRVEHGPSFRFEGLKSALDMKKPPPGVPGASLLLDEVKGERIRMRVEVRRSDVEKEDEEEYCEAVVLDLPSSSGTVCEVGSEEETLRAPWVGSYLRCCSTAAGSMMPPRSMWFLLRVRRVPVRSRRLSPDQPGPLVWGWVSIEIWPVMYLISSGCRCRFRLTSGEGLYPPVSQRSDDQSPPPWASTTISKSSTAKPKDVDEARRALQEKLQKLSWKKLQGTIQSEEEGAAAGGGRRERNISLDASLSSSQDGSVWESFDVQAGQAVTVTSLDPRNGLAVNVYPSGNAGMAFFINPSTILDWTRPIGTILPLLEISSFRPLVPWIPYCQRLPAHLGPSLMVNVTPGVLAKNECPFPISIVSLGPHSVSTTNPPSLEHFSKYTAGDFKGYDELGMVSIGAGKETPIVNWIRPRSAEEALEPPPLQCAVGITFEKDEDEDGLALVQVREARRSDQWVVQSWSRPLVLAGGIEETSVVLLKAKNLVGAPGDVLVLPLVVTLYPETLPDNPDFLRHRLVVRPRIALHNFVALPLGIGYGQLWLKAGACDKSPPGGHLPFVSKGKAPALPSSDNTQVILLRRRLPPAPTHRQQQSDPGWLAPDTPAREKSNPPSSSGPLGGLHRIWCRSYQKKSNTAGSDSDEEEKPKQEAEQLFAELSLHVVDPDLGRHLEANTSGDGTPDSVRQGLFLDAGDERVTRLTVRSDGLAAWGANGRDVLRLRVKLRFHEGTHHLVLSMEPSVSLIVQNRSRYDMCLRLEGEEEPQAGGERGNGPNTLYVCSRARVEWQPEARPLTLQSSASSLVRSGSLDDSNPGVSVGKDRKGSGADEEAVMGFKRSSFLSRRAEVHVFRLRCHLSQQQSSWSEIFSTSERHQMVDIRFPLSESPVPPEAGGRKTYDMNLRVTSLSCGPFSCITIDDSSMLLNTGGNRSRPPTPVSASSLGPERSLWADVLAVSRPAWDVTLQVTSFDLQVLDERVGLRGYASPAKKQPTTSHRNSLYHHRIHLPAFLYGRASGLHLRLSSCKTRPDTRDAPYAANVAAHAITGYRSLTVSLNDFQFDNLLPNCDFPIIWRNLRPTNPSSSPVDAMEFQFTEAFLNQDVFGQGRPKSFVQSLSMQVARTHIALEGPMIQALTTFYLSLSNGGDGAPNNADPASRPLRVTNDVLMDSLMDPSSVAAKDSTLIIHELVAVPRLYFESVHLGSLAVVLSARLTVPGSSVFIGLDGSPLYFDEVVLRSVVSTPSSFLRSLVANYVADTILRSPAVVGSLEILGNPTTLISRVFQGFKDVVVLSAAGSVDGPFAALAGAGRGLLSLTRHIVGGTLSSLSGFSSSVKRNLEGLSPRKKSADNTPREKSGLGKGLLKVVTTPISGAMDVVSWTTEQIISTTGVNRGEYSKERLVYPEGGPGVTCGLHLEAFYRNRCRLNFPLGTFVGEVSALYSLNCAQPTLLIILVMAGEQLYLLTGSAGAERIKKAIALSSIHKWRYGRLPAPPPKSTVLQDAHHVIEISRKVEGDEVIRLWVQEEGARQLRAYLNTGQ